MAGFDEYRAVLAKVDAKFAEIAARHPGELACRRGCHSCCLPGLSVTEVERAHIAAWLREDPQRIERLRGLAAADPHQGQRCAFLDGDGECAIFEARPLLCRAHGAPTRLPGDSGQAALLDVCRLNFSTAESPPLTQLPPGDFLDQGLLATLLSVVDRRFDAARAGQRSQLTLAAVLAEPPT